MVEELHSEFTRIKFDAAVPTMYIGETALSVAGLHDDEVDIIHGELLSHRLRGDTAVSGSWLKKQSEFLRGLGVREKATLYGYTRQGDEIVNSYMRDPEENLFPFMKSLMVPPSTRFMFFPFYGQYRDMVLRCGHGDIKAGGVTKVQVTLVTEVEVHDDDYRRIPEGGEHDLGTLTVWEWIEELRAMPRTARYEPERYVIMMSIAKHLKADFWLGVLEAYIDDVRWIIRNAPRPKKTMVVYRGVGSDRYVRGNPLAFVHNGLLSTSLSWSLAHTFLKGRPCCMMRIVVPAHTPCVCLFGYTAFKGELEVLMDTSSVMVLGEASVPRGVKVLRHSQWEKDVEFGMSELELEPVAQEVVYSGRRYKVRKEGKKKYIKVKGKRVFLAEIAGKY